MSIFTIYTKTLSPTQSPALTPLQSPVLGPIPAPNMDKFEDNGKDKDKDKVKDKDRDNDAAIGGVAFMGSMLLCDCCNQRCFNKPKSRANSTPAAAMDPDFALEQYASRITHATHYTYNASTPRLVSDFDNNINININNPISVFLDRQT